MENAGHPSSETPAATNYFLQYISSRCVSWAWCPASERPRVVHHPELGFRGRDSSWTKSQPVLLGGAGSGGRGRKQILPKSCAPPPPPRLLPLFPLWAQLWRGQDGRQTGKAGPQFCLAPRVTSVTWISCPEQKPVGQWLVGRLLLPARF